MAHPTSTEARSADERRPARDSRGDREPAPRGAHLPAAARLHGPGHANDPEIYDRAATEEGFREFWTAEAKRIDWIEPWTELLDWQLPYAKWFVGGKLNVSVNCLDRHVATGSATRSPTTGRASPATAARITYHELLDEICRFANALRALGVKKGDRVAIYMPMIPELPVAMLACARIGAPHSVVFGGFSRRRAGRTASTTRECSVVITADGGYRKGAAVPLKANADEAIGTDAIGRALRRGQAHRRRGRHGTRVATTGGTSSIADQPTDRHAGADGLRGPPLPALHLRHHGQAEGDHAHHRRLPGRASRHPSAHLRHQAGRRVLVHGRHRLGDRPQYIVYGPLANATTGSSTRAPSTSRTRTDGPRSRRKYRATILYTAPTAIRALMKYGDEAFAADDLSSLRLLGSRRRADQPGGVGLVLEVHRRRAAARSSTRGGRPRPG